MIQTVYQKNAVGGIEDGCRNRGRREEMRLMECFTWAKKYLCSCSSDTPQPEVCDATTRGEGKTPNRSYLPNKTHTDESNELKDNDTYKLVSYSMAFTLLHVKHVLFNSVKKNQVYPHREK